MCFVVVVVCVWVCSACWAAKKRVRVLCVGHVFVLSCLCVLALGVSSGWIDDGLGGQQDTRTQHAQEKMAIGGGLCGAVFLGVLCGPLAKPAKVHHNREIPSSENMGMFVVFVRACVFSCCWNECDLLNEYASNRGFVRLCVCVRAREACD